MLCSQLELLDFLPFIFLLLQPSAILFSIKKFSSPFSISSSCVFTFSYACHARGRNAQGTLGSNLKTQLTSNATSLMSPSQNNQENTQNCKILFRAVALNENSLSQQNGENWGEETILFESKPPSEKKSNCKNKKRYITRICISFMKI